MNYDRQRKSEEAVIEIKVTNTRNEDINVLLVEHINGDWIIKDESLNYQKKMPLRFTFHCLYNLRNQECLLIPTEKNGNRYLKG